VFVQLAEEERRHVSDEGLMFILAFRQRALEMLARFDLLAEQVQQPAEPQMRLEQRRVRAERRSESPQSLLLPFGDEGRRPFRWRVQDAAVRTDEERGLPARESHVPHEGP
jgi:hypothetical protein